VRGLRIISLKRKKFETNKFACQKHKEGTQNNRAPKEAQKGMKMDYKT